MRKIVLNLIVKLWFIHVPLADTVVEPNGDAQNIEEENAQEEPNEDNGNFAHFYLIFPHVWM